MSGPIPDANIPADAEAPPLAEVLDDVVGFFDRFMYFEKDEQCHALALWTIGSFVFGASDIVAYLHIKSPEKRAGKTLCLDILEMLTNDAIAAANISPAALYRLVEKRRPTLLLDEVDAIFTKGRGADPSKEELRGLLNAGYRKGKKVFRSNKKGEIEEFSPFCPKALAGIGDLPDTVADRSIVIALQRKPRDVSKERFRQRFVAPGALELQDKIRVATSGIEDELSVSLPHLPDELNDREQDTWELLFAIADLAGGVWPHRARDSAKSLSVDAFDNTETLGQLLLADIREVWVDGDQGVQSSVLLERLHGVEESPWGDWYGNPIKARFLAEKLKPYGVRSKQVKLDGKNLRGYRWNDLAPVFARYLDATSATSATTQSYQGVPGRYPNATQTLPDGGSTLVADEVADENPRDTREVAEVAQVAHKYDVAIPVVKDWVGIVEQFERSNGSITFKIRGRTEVTKLLSEIVGDTFGLGDSVSISPNGDGLLHATISERTVPL
jgi:hypothetical protein